MAKLTPQDRNSMSLLYQTQDAKIKLLESALADAKRHQELMSKTLNEMAEERNALRQAMAILRKYGL
jgi:hypothetical protein